MKDTRIIKKKKEIAKNINDPQDKISIEKDRSVERSPLTLCFLLKTETDDKNIDVS